MTKFNERLKILRKEANLSQEELAKKIGVSKSSVNMYERGEREPGIACGEPILAEENIEGYVKAPAYCEGSFALRCKGDSMTGARIMDGDIVIIRQQPDVDDGDIAAVLIEDEATLKRVYKMPDRLILRAENPCYAPIDISGGDLANVRILGKAVYFISNIK